MSSLCHFVKIVEKWLPGIKAVARRPHDDIPVETPTLCLCLWSRHNLASHSPYPFDHWVISYHTEPITETDYKWFGDDERAVFRVATKLCAFLSSTNVTYDIVARPSVKRRVGKTKKMVSLRPVHVIRFLKNYSASSGPSEPSGRTVGVRHWVRGHYNKFRRGRIYERAVADGKIKPDQAALVWVPRHQRGPEAGEQVATRYVVEKSAQG